MSSQGPPPAMGQPTPSTLPFSLNVASNPGWAIWGLWKAAGGLGKEVRIQSTTELVVSFPFVLLCPSTWMQDSLKPRSRNHDAQRAPKTPLALAWRVGKIVPERKISHGFSSCRATTQPQAISPEWWQWDRQQQVPRGQMLSAILWPASIFPMVCFEGQGLIVTKSYTSFVFTQIFIIFKVSHFFL